jgi:hypothetical protein
MLRSCLSIIAVVGIAFLLALYCWLSGRDNPLEDFGNDLTNPNSINSRERN